MRTWYFAEGNSRRDFQTFFTLLNLTDQPASVTAAYDRDDGIRLMQWLGVEPKGRVSLSANDVVGPRAFGVTFTADQDIVVERATTWGPGQHGETTVGYAPDGKRNWHFAEGTTRGGVSTYFVTQNLSDSPTDVVARFTRDDGSTVDRSFGLAPRARDAFRMNDLVQDTAFAASFRADQDVIIERTILAEGEHGEQTVAGRRAPSRQKDERGNGLAEGDRSTLANGPPGILGGLGFPTDGNEPGARTWFFAEGSTRRPYETHFVLFNPGSRSVTARLSLIPMSGDATVSNVGVPALGRVVLNARELLPASDFTTSITADGPVIAERAYASTGDGLYGTLGYTPTQPRTSSRAWYFADGNTSGQREMFFIVANLADRPAQIQATYFVDGADRREQSLTVAPRGRLSLRANDTVSDAAFAARFVADRDIVVERTVYFPGGSGFSSLGAAP